VKSIMLVDDSVTILMSMETLLQKASFRMQAVRSGEEALSLLQQGSTPDLVLVDLNMGPMDGIELIREARKIRPLRFVPMLMLTSESHATRRHEAKSAGATGWIVKPVEAKALLELIHRLLPSEVT
jgi:two-component system chemotaxis response regulator CheY